MRIKVKNAKDLELKLSFIVNNLKKNETLEVLLINFTELPKVPSIFMKYGLSLVNAEELPKGYILMKAVLRFPKHR